RLDGRRKYSHGGDPKTACRQNPIMMNGKRRPQRSEAAGGGKRVRVFAKRDPRIVPIRRGRLGPRPKCAYHSCFATKVRKMTEGGIERRLAAILAADVAGYSRLMGSDEVATFASLKAHRRELVDPNIARHR